MKKIVLAGLFLIMASFCANAQLKGKLYLGGNVGLDTNISVGAISNGYDTISVDDVEVYGIANFTIGYFISDKWRISAYYETNAEADSSNGENQNELYYDSIGMGLAFYKEIADGLYYVPEIKICSVKGEVAFEEASFPLDGYSYNISLFQLEFKPTKHFATSVNLGYLNILDLGGATTVQGTSLGLAVGSIVATIGLRPTVTFKYYF